MLKFKPKGQVGHQSDENEEEDFQTTERFYSPKKPERAMLFLQTKSGVGEKLEMQRMVTCQRVLKDILRGLGFI